MALAVQKREGLRARMAWVDIGETGWYCLECGIIRIYSSSSSSELSLVVRVSGKVGGVAAGETAMIEALVVCSEWGMLAWCCREHCVWQDAWEDAEWGNVDI
jgi:hypothetical protein